MIVRTHGREKTELEDDLPVCNVENIEVTNDEIPFVHVCTECDAENDLKTCKPDEKLTKRRAMRASTVQRTDRRKKKGQVENVEEVIGEQKKDPNCREASTQVAISGSELHIDQNRPLVRTSNIEGCL